MLLRGRRAGPVLAVAALLLTGCTGEDSGRGPAPMPTETVAPSPTPSTTAEPTEAPALAPEPPADLNRMDESGAAAAAEYFLELYPYVLQTGDFEAWDALSWSECAFCRDTKAYVNETLSAGGSFEGGMLEATVVAIHPRDTLIGGIPIDVDIHQGVTVERSATDEVLNVLDEEQVQSRVDMIQSDSGWKVLEVADRPVK